MSSSTEPVIAIIAGEHSGDLLGAGLMEQLQQLYPHCRFIGVGGPKMAAMGLSSLVPMEDLAVMGLAEVLRSLPKLLKHRSHIVTEILAAQPDVFVGIDAPDFNLPIAKKLKRQGIKTVHYVSPSVWAWRQGRIKGIKQAVDHVLCLLPFEKQFYDQHQLAATFVGHPLADEIPLLPHRDQARAALQLDPQQTVLGLLPGSRAGEIARLGPIFLATAMRLHQRDPQLQFLVPMVSSSRRQQFEQLWQQHAPELPLHIVEGGARQVLEAADAVLLTSGTVTLEALLYKRPMVVAYKFNWLSYQIIKRMFKARFFSLPNLLADSKLVPEVVQQQATPEHLAELLWQQLATDQSQLQQKFLSLHKQLKVDANKRSAAVVAQLIAK